MTLLQPRFWVGHLVMVVAVVAAILLGKWQFDAWTSERLAAGSEAEKEPPVELADLFGPDQPFENRILARQVSFAGDIGGDPFYISGRVQSGEPELGYWVVVPVKVEGSLLPVVLGWSPDAGAPDLPRGLDVTGWLQPTEGLEGGDNDPTDDIYPALRIASLTQRFDTDLYGGFVIANNEVVGELAQVQPPYVPGASAGTAWRNLLYAVQWWIFGAFACYIWVRWCRDETGRPVPS